MEGARRERQLKMVKLEALMDEYRGRVVLVVGLYKGGPSYFKVKTVYSQVDEVVKRMNKVHGEGRWIAVAGETAASPKGKECLGNLVKHMGAACGVKVAGVHSLAKDGSVPDYVTWVCPTPNDDHGEDAFGVPTGPTESYLSLKSSSCLAGCIAFGGHKEAAREAKRAVRMGVRFKYYETTMHGGGHGDIHEWASRIRKVSQSRTTLAHPYTPMPAVAPVACLTMHQPYASLLVAGIKRVEGRVWSSGLKGPLWIHAAAHVPTRADIVEVEDFYRRVYASEDLPVKFPSVYPTSALIGIVNVVDVQSSEDFLSDESIPDTVKKESMSPFVFRCKDPAMLVAPIGMAGQHKIWRLEKESATGAYRALRPAAAPSPKLPW